MLINGYGGFDVSLLPEFTRSALYFLERGGIYAVANLRGGGEFGEAWHRAGMLENKPHVFEDFEAVIRWFAQSGISQPERIAITGGSNGGLLVGALMTRAPDAFRAAASYVGLYDMLRYRCSRRPQLWTSEYGDPNEPEAARYLYGYSPYHHVTPGTRYPAALIETADHDTRVFCGHSTKFAARLQEAQAGPTRSTSTWSTSRVTAAAHRSTSWSNATPACTRSSNANWDEGVTGRYREKVL